MSFIGWFILLGLIGVTLLRGVIGRRMQGLREDQLRSQLSGGAITAVICGVISFAEYVMRAGSPASWIWLFNLPGAIATWYAILAIAELGKRAGSTLSGQMPSNSLADRSKDPSQLNANTAAEIKLRVVQRSAGDIPVRSVKPGSTPAGSAQQRSPSGPALAAGSWEDILRRVREASTAAQQPPASGTAATSTPAPASAQPGTPSGETYPAPAFTFWHPEAEPAPTVDPAQQAASAAAAAAAGASKAHATAHPEERQPERRRGVHDVADTVHHEGMKVELGVTRKIGEGAATSAAHSAAQPRLQPVVATAGKSALPVRPPGPVRIGGSSLARPSGPVSLGGGSMARKPGPVSLGGGGLARPHGPVSLSAGQARLAGPLSGSGRTGVVSRIGVTTAQHTPRLGTDVKRQESATGGQPDEAAYAAVSAPAEVQH